MGLAIFGQDTSIEYVVSRGAYVASKDRWLNTSGFLDGFSLRDGKTALMYAAENGHESTVEKLVSLGADIRIENKWLNICAF